MDQPCVNGIGERAGNADLLSCILAFRYGFGVGEAAVIGDPLDLSWARRFGLWAAYASGSRCRPPGPGSAATRSRTSRASTPTGR